jgi:peptidoglycan/xylan/chitin deacetylase (PgdA/CDA1 family)
VGGSRLRFVFAGLLLGVLIAIVVASKGCGDSHHAHASAPKPRSVVIAPHAAFGGRRAARHAVRHHDRYGPFFGYRRAHVTRSDAPRTRDVALTFDDGPGPLTMQLLAHLHRLHARATFFVVGSMAAIRPWAVRAARRAGMEVENHTWSHPAMTRLSRHAQRIEIERANRLIRRLTGRRPRFFRPPGWRFNGRTARIVASERLVGVLRTVDTRDWTLPGVRTIVRRALSVRPGGIIALHDAGGYSRAQTLAALPHIVRGLRRRHLRLVTISRLYEGLR